MALGADGKGDRTAPGSNCIVQSSLRLTNGLKVGTAVMRFAGRIMVKPKSSHANEI